MTTRLIGAVVMVHGDEGGRFFRRRSLRIRWSSCRFRAQLARNRVADGPARARRADRARHACAHRRPRVADPGWKFNEWELRGVRCGWKSGPRTSRNRRWCSRAAIRARNRLRRWRVSRRTWRVCSRRFSGRYERALKFREEHTSTTDSYEEFKAIMEGRLGFVVSPWCGSAACEAAIKAETQATIRNIPFDSPPATGKKCLKCGEPATAHAWFAKAY